MAYRRRSSRSRSRRSYGGGRRSIGRRFSVRSRGRSGSRRYRGGGRQRVELVIRQAPASAAAGNLIQTPTGLGRVAGMSDQPGRVRF